MDYEKLYKEAISRADKHYARHIVEDIFPELKESEDEQHRKWILEYLYDGLRKSDEQFKDQYKSAIAWLEKQAKKQTISYCQENCKGYQETGKCFADGECKAKIEAERKSGWCEEDEKIYKSILDDTITETQLDDKQITWLKSLKDRVQLQPKQEWSDEDEKKRRLLIKVLEVNHPNTHFKVNPINTTNMEAMSSKELVDWLKSLKPHWKPSEEQMEALFEAKLASIKNREYFLGLLYEDLKKL